MTGKFKVGDRVRMTDIRRGRPIASWTKYNGELGYVVSVFRVGLEYAYDVQPDNFVEPDSFFEDMLHLEEEDIPE